MVRMMFTLACLFFSLVAFADEPIKITSDNVFHVEKKKLQTNVFLVDENTNQKKLVFSQNMRDVIQWIHSPKNENRILFVTRPMIAGPEKSRFWLYENEKISLLGQTVCDDHTVDFVSFTKIVYRCFTPDPNEPLKSLAQTKTFVVNDQNESSK